LKFERNGAFNQPFVVYQEPAKRKVTLESDAWLPAMQALLIASGWAIVAALAVGILAYFAHWPWWVIPAVLLATFAVTFASHVTSIIQERRELLWKLETQEGRDLDGDGVVGKPEPFTVELVTKHAGGQRMQFIEFGVEEERARMLAKGLVAGRPFSESEWTGGGRPFSRREFRELRTELLERGLLEWRNPRAPAQGVELTAPGRHVMQRLAQE